VEGYADGDAVWGEGAGAPGRDDEGGSCTGSARTCDIDRMAKIIKVFGWRFQSSIRRFTEELKTIFSIDWTVERLTSVLGPISKDQ
jgi:hypothetical protein